MGKAHLILISSLTSFPSPVKAQSTKISLSLGRVHYRFRGVGSIFSFLFHFSIKFVNANRIAPDGTPRFAASHLGLFCLSMSHNKDARLIYGLSHFCFCYSRELCSISYMLIFLFLTYHECKSCVCHCIVLIIDD